MKRYEFPQDKSKDKNKDKKEDGAAEILQQMRALAQKGSPEENWTRACPLVDEAFAEGRAFNIGQYLAVANVFLRHTKKDFVANREDDLIKWLAKNISDIFADVRLSQTNHGDAAVKKHFVQGDSRKRETVSVLFPVKPGPLEDDFFLDLIRRRPLPFSFKKESYFSMKNEKKKEVILYFEFQKEGGSFTSQDITSIEQEIPQMVLLEKTGEEHVRRVLKHDPERMRRRLSLAFDRMKEGDKPQAIIELIERRPSGFMFSIAICAVCRLGEELLDTKIIGRHIYPQTMLTDCNGATVSEGLISMVEMPSIGCPSPIEAREKLIKNIEGAVGPCDYPYGRSDEEIERTLSFFAQECGRPTREIEPFFYSITPRSAQSIKAIPLLLHAYKSLKKGLDDREKLPLRFHAEGSIISVCTKMQSEAFLSGLNTLEESPLQQPFFSKLRVDDIEIVCYTVHLSQAERIEHFKKEVISYVQQWLGKSAKKKVLSIASTVPCTSFDPRVELEGETDFIHRLLFAGLMKITEKGVPEKALAKDFKVLREGRHYRFWLKESYWSNGSPVTSEDFANSWKDSTDTTTFSTSAQCFYPIENGQKIRENLLKPSSLGVNCPNPSTLDVFLDYPCPYFLELCAHPSLFPISKENDRENPDWSLLEGKNYVCNGPFTLEKRGKEEIVLAKNPQYWDVRQVSPDEITICLATEKVGSALFSKQQVDVFFGPKPTEKKSKSAHAPISKDWEETTQTAYLFFNCECPLFSNAKVRQAIAGAIDRKELVKQSSPHSAPYFNPYPHPFAQLPPVDPFAIQAARDLLNEGLAESTLSLKSIASVELMVEMQSAEIAAAAVEQINQNLALNWKVKTLEPIRLLRETAKGNQQVILCHCRDRITNPSYFLETFASTKSITNYSLWSPARIREIIRGIHSEKKEEEIRKLHQEGEKLMQELVPFSPLLITPLYARAQPYLSTPTEEKKFNPLQADNKK